MAKSKTLTVRLSAKIWDKLESASKDSPYKISLTSIVERGIELASQELSEFQKKPWPPAP